MILSQHLVPSLEEVKVHLKGNFNLILSEYYSILSDWLGPSQLHVFSWIPHILIQLV